VADGDASKVFENASKRALPLVRFTGRERYWFAKPVRLTQASRIQVHAMYRDPALVADAFGGVNKSATATTLTSLHLSYSTWRPPLSV
jgi:hypothetical protein